MELHSTNLAEFVELASCYVTGNLIVYKKVVIDFAKINMVFVSHTLLNPSLTEVTG